MKKYSIHESKTGKHIADIEAPEDIVEALSSDSIEGHFQANLLEKLSELGRQSVYALPH